MITVADVYAVHSRPVFCGAQVLSLMKTDLSVAVQKSVYARLPCNHVTQENLGGAVQQTIPGYAARWLGCALRSKSIVSVVPYSAAVQLTAHPSYVINTSILRLAWKESSILTKSYS